MATHLRSTLAHALSHSPTMRLYFPPEFGFDASIGATPTAPSPYFDCFDVPEWNTKTSHHALLSRVLANSNIQICRLANGLFLHDGIGPWSGFHTGRGMYSVVGDPNSGKTTYTDLGDVARVIAVLGARVMRGEVVPERLRIAGCVATAAEIRDVMVEAGAGEVGLRGVDLEGYKSRVLGKAYEDRAPVPFVRLIMAMGLGDYRPEVWGNDNEIVNPGETLWRWKGIRDLAEETGGRPNGMA
jgi:hypothetical protein